MADEYVLRQAVLKAIYTSTAPALEVKAMPAADVVEVRHAYKIDITATEDFISWYKCSACGYNGLFLEDKYCSCCGAKLDGG